MNLFIPGDLVKIAGSSHVYVVVVIGQRGYSIQGRYSQMITFAYDWEVSPA